MQNLQGSSQERPAINYETIAAPHDANLIKLSVDCNIEQIKYLQDKIFIDEANKDPLKAMALIQHIGSTSLDAQAQKISKIYQAYRSFIRDADLSYLENTCNMIISDEQSDSLSLNIAIYLKALVKKGPIIVGEEEIKAQTFIRQLIPGIEKAFDHKAPSKLYPAQKIKIAEMELPHYAFPDLVKHEGLYYACFREAQTHVSFKDHGKIRILQGSFDSNSQQWSWKNHALLEINDQDLRDPKFFVTHDNVLHLIMDASTIDEKNSTTYMKPYTASLKDNNWTVSSTVVDESADGKQGQWIWRITWHPTHQKGYAFSYNNSGVLTLVSTTDGITFEKVTVLSCPPLEHLNEATIRFKDNGDAIAFIRTQKNGIIAHSTEKEGYTSWSTHVLPFRVGGPNFLFSANDNMIAGTRYFLLTEDNCLDEMTVIGKLTDDSFIPQTFLRSSYDNSYPGMVLEEDGSVAVIYYSSDTADTSDIFIQHVK